MVMTYTTLVSQIKAYVNRQNDMNFNAQIDNFIYQAHQRVCRESKSVGLEDYVTRSFTTGEPVYAKPARWRRTITFNYGTGNTENPENSNTRNQLYLRSYEYCRNYWPDDSQYDTDNPPLYYCDYGYSNFLIVPTPPLEYPFEIGYLQLPEPLSENNQTNWLTDYAPDVLLYACLLEAIPFLKNDERIPVWNSLYEKGLQSLNIQDDLRIADRASNRSAD